jgi:hypothetical protein
MSEKIEPALSRDGWRDREYESPEYGSHAVVIKHDADGTVCVSEWFGGPETPGDVIELPPEAIAPAIALLNAALPNEDPRKITREKIARLRSLLQVSDDYAGDDFDESGAFLDALESYLPPEQANTVGTSA